MECRLIDGEIPSGHTQSIIEIGYARDRSVFQEICGIQIDLALTDYTQEILGKLLLRLSFTEARMITDKLSRLLDPQDITKATKQQ